MKFIYNETISKEDKKILNELRNDITSKIEGINNAPFSNCDSSARKMMYNAHIGQACVLTKPEPSRINTGFMENLCEKYRYRKSIDDPVRIISVINAIENNGIDDISYNPKIVIIYKNERTKEINYIEVKKFESRHPNFGYENFLNKDYDLSVDSRHVPDETIADIKHPDEDVFSVSTELNTLYTTDLRDAEDGYIVMEEALPKLTTVKLSHAVIALDDTTYPLNIHGDEENYKIIPDIGDTLEPGKPFAILRNIPKSTKQDAKSISLDKITSRLNNSSVKSFTTRNPLLDDVLCFKGGKCKVVNIEVLMKHDYQKKIYPEITQQLIGYNQQSRRYYKEILDTYNEIVRLDTLRGDRNQTHKKIHPKLMNLFVDAASKLVHTDGSMVTSGIRKKLKLSDNKTKLADVHIKLTLQQYTVPEIGTKLTDSHGGKGVICAIVPASETPVDKNGTRAEIIGSPESTVNRMNTGRLYEQYLSAVLIDIRLRLIKFISISEHVKDLKNKSSVLSYVKDLSNEVLKNSLNEYIHLLEVVSPRQYESYKILSKEMIIDIVSEIILDKPYVFVPADNNINTLETFRYIRKVFKPLLDTVTYENNGNPYQSAKKCRIAPISYMVLEKTPDDVSATSSATYNTFGVLGSNTNDNSKFKNFTPIKRKAIKTCDETGVRLNSCYLPKEFMNDVLDASRNPSIHSSIYKTIMTTKNPFELKSIIKKKTKGSSVPFALLNQHLNAMGINLTNTETD